MLKYLGFLTLLASVIYSSGADGPELVVRGQIKLTLAGAERVVIAARERASALSVAENIAVVDDGVICWRLLGWTEPVLRAWILRSPRQLRPLPCVGKPDPSSKGRP